MLTWKPRIGLWLIAKSLKNELTDTGCVLARSCDSCTRESGVLENKLADMGCVLARSCDSCTHESEEEEVELADMGCVLARSCDSCTHKSEEEEVELADMGCVLARSCDSCTHESEFSEDELADTGCVLARSCDSCTRESGVLENKLADMGCVLARSCDSCTHESEEEEEVELADMGCVLARSCDSCTHESEFSEDELADTGCVLARGCDSCTRESEGLESEVADMGCVLARGCDSCTHEPWFCGLKCGDEVGRGDSSNLETRFVNDPSRDLCATVPMKVVLVRAHEWFDDHSEVSVEQQIEPYLKFLRPLLSQVADNTDASWWLLDSGASTSVLAESNLSAFRSVLQDSEGLGGYKAANGSSVNMSGTAEIGVQMHMSGTSGDDWCWKKARLNVLVGSIRHNILSITSFGRFGMEIHTRSKRF